MTREESIVKLSCLVLDQPDCEGRSTEEYVKDKLGKPLEECSDDEITDLLMELQFERKS